MSAVRDTFLFMEGRLTSPILFPLKGPLLLNARSQLAVVPSVHSPLPICRAGRLTRMCEMFRLSLRHHHGLVLTS